MLRNAGWCIATTYRKTETTKTVYTKIKLPDCKDHYYVVTMSSKQSLQKQCIPSGNTGTTNCCSTSHQEILDEESVDVSGVASKINQEYGIHITEENWQESYQVIGCFLEPNWQNRLHHPDKSIRLVMIMMWLDVYCF